MEKKKTRAADLPPARRDYDPSQLENARKSTTPVLVDLSFIKFTSAQFNELCLALERTTTITKLNLSACNLGENIVPLLKTLEGNITLTALDLSYNNPPKSAIKALDKLLSVNFTLTSINLKSHSLDPLVSKDSEWILQSLVDNAGVAKFIAGDTSYLRLASRKIERFPMWMLQYSHVTQLNLHQNLLSSLPSEIKRMVNLVKMNISANQLVSIPKEIGQLTKLQYCDLSANLLTSLPEAAVNLAELQFLDLSANKFKRLQPFLGNMEKLQKIVATNNPLTNIPKEILESGDTQDMKKHLRDTEGSVRANRMKLMLVGKENVGKTSLIRALMRAKPTSTKNPLMNVVVGLARRDSNPKLPTPTDEEPNIATDGIAINEWAVSNSSASCSSQSSSSSSSSSSGYGSNSKEELTFCTFDFAGQEVYYVSHQFFLSRRALYIVTFNLLEGLRFLEKIEYWFQSIRMRAPHAPIVLVGTHIDDPRCTTEYITNVFREISARLNLQKRGFRLAKQFAVSCKTGAGIDELREALIELAMKDPTVMERIPRAYVSLETKLRSLVLSKAISPPIMSWSEFKQLANECGLSDRSVMGAAQFLNDVGSLVYFHEPDTSLHDMVILDPQWVTDLLATIVTLKHNFIKDGIIKHSDLRLLWKFNESLHPRLLKLLERFEISYPLPDPQEPKSLVPCLLPEQKPAFDLVWNKRDFEIEYNRRYELQYSPRGLFSRLMIRLLNFAHGVVYWQNGILLADSGGKALVELQQVNALAKDLVVLVRGNTKNAKFLLRIIVETLESLMKSWFQVPYTQSIWCPMCLGDPTREEDPYAFPYDECSLRFSSGSTEPMQCRQDELHRVPIERLVPDVALADFQGRLVSSHDIELLDHVATGPFSKVYRAFWNEQEVGVKEIQLYTIENVEEKLSTFYNFRHEVWVMSGVSHPNIVTLLAFAVNPFLIVMEWVPLGDLYRHLHTEQLSKQLTWPARIRVAIDVAQGMSFLHSAVPPVLHRDLKSPNIFLVDTYHRAPVVAKVADFGLSSRLFISELKERSKGRAVELPTWLAPEVLSELPYTEKSDVYAFGVVMWELYTSEHPFQEFTFKYQHQLEEAIKCGTRPIVPGNCPPTYSALLTRCWDNSPAKRPTFPEILNELRVIQQQETMLVTSSSAALMIATASPLPTTNIPLATTLLSTSDESRGSPMRSPTFLRSSTATPPIPPLSPSSSVPPTASPDLYHSQQISPHSGGSSNASPMRSGSLTSTGPLLVHSLSAPSLDTRLPRRDTVFVNGSLEQRIQLPGNARASSLLALGESWVVVGTQEGHLFLYSGTNGDLHDRCDYAHSAAVISLVTVGAELWSSGEDGTVNMWEVKRGRSPRPFARSSVGSREASPAQSSPLRTSNPLLGRSGLRGSVSSADEEASAAAAAATAQLRNVEAQSNTNTFAVLTGLMNVVVDNEKKKKKLRSITLTDGHLLYQDRKNSVNPSLLGRRGSSQALGIDLRGARVELISSDTEKDYAFIVTPKSEALPAVVFSVEQEELRNKWFTNIRDRIEALKESALVLLQRRKMPRVILSMASIDDDVWLGARDQAAIAVWTSRGAAKKDININFDLLRQLQAKPSGVSLPQPAPIDATPPAVVPYPSFGGGMNIPAPNNPYPSFASSALSDSAGNSNSTTPISHHRASPVAWDIRPRSNSLTNRLSPAIGSQSPVRPSALSISGAPVSLGSVSCLLGRDEFIWAGIDRHIVLVSQKDTSTMKLLEDRHESPVKQIIAVGSSVWSGSFDKLCMWNDGGEVLREVERGSLPPVRCLLPLGEFVWIAGDLTRTPRASESPGVTRGSSLQIWSQEGRLVKILDTPHTSIITSLVKVGERCCWSGGKDGMLCVWV